MNQERRLAHELRRDSNLDRIGREAFDVAVIGGGITGAGIALDAASRGLKVALVEKRDFASGTSSRSSKLIHGGLRYLEQFQFSLVREALLERATLRKMAPHLSEPLAFLVPVYGAGKRSPLGGNRLKLRLGLWLYDLLAGGRNIARHRWVGRDEALGLAPALESNDLRGAFLYYDCLTDDARLVIEVIKEAARRGAVAANYARARGFVKVDGRVAGVEVEDSLGERRISLSARVVVNATGVWSGEISQLAAPRERIRLRPSKGIHVVLPSEKFGNRTAVLIPSLGEQRFLFVIPWQGRTLVGTTDTDYTGELDDPQPESEEINRVIESAARYFPGAALLARDAVSSFAGLRPLVGGDDKSTKELSRKEEIIESETGLISIIGGKLTTWRRMAERVVDLVVDRLERRGAVGPSITARLRLAASEALAEDAEQEAKRAAIEFGAPVATIRHLMRSYGGNFRAVLEITRGAEELKRALIDGLPHIEAEVVYATRYEMATTVEDFLSRRTRIAILARDRGRECAARVASLMDREQHQYD
ncbi:MAG TPA: glycerol-3-phosphate dehydrogenase/oxidase [Blastocatellia bacterium]|nr:glycerol-3-phosphate dehydrogenase/oxidase [Blastocatellia bacterium]